jgi:hypothetical protein
MLKGYNPSSGLYTLFISHQMVSWSNEPQVCRKPDFISWILALTARVHLPGAV